MKKLLLLLSLCLVPSSYAAVSAFQLPWMNAPTAGTIYKSTDYKGGIFVVEAYFLDCPWCNYNAPAVNALAAKFKEEPRVQVLDVGIDRYDYQYTEWINRHKPNHPVLKDSSRKLITQLGTSGYPSTYVLDCRGNLVSSHIGAWEDADKLALEKTIELELAKDCLSEAGSFF